MVDPELQSERLRPLLRREYDRLVELGFFEDEPIELLRGMLVEMSPQGIDHGELSGWLAQWFSAMLPMAEYRVRAHSPFAATDDSEPEPDVLVAKRVGGERRGHPTDALLIVEVSLSSLRKDRKLKLGIYAEAGVPEYWIVDVERERVEVYTEPSGREYRRCETVERAGVLRPTQLPGVELAVTALPWDAK
jgi:Uma2 family endonuclease